VVRRRVLFLFAAATTSLLLVSGCSGDDGGSGRAGSAGASPTSAHAGHSGGQRDAAVGPRVTKSDLLDKRDLPPGARFQDIKLDEFVTQNVALLERIITDPKECAGLLKTVYQASGSDKHGLATGARVNDGRGLIVQTVGKADPKAVVALRKLAQKCPMVHSSVDEQKSRATYKKLDTSRLKADKSYGVVVMNRVAGQAAARSVQIAAIKDGLGVSLTISGDTGTNDVALANKVLAKLH
jgi:hypothetical protein